MDIEKLITELRAYTYWLGQDGPESRDIHPPICDLAADALEEIQSELEQVKQERDAAVEDLRKLCPAWKWDGHKEG